jgi:hypothetical protein
MRRNPGKALAIVLLLAACGPQRPDDGNGDNGGDGDDDGNGGDGNAPPTGDGCPDESKLIYTVDRDSRQMSRFHPQTKTFTDLGKLSCSTSSPFSMAIARDATAWVLHSDGALFRVDTKNNLACTQSAWEADTQDLFKFGMGFSTDQAGGTTDTLYISGGNDPGTDASSTLARLDLSSFQPSKVGTVTDWPELTGTGNAELWGFFPSGNNARIVKLDKTTGAALQTYREPVLDNSKPTTWAFAFHGGSFWVFLQKSTETKTFIYQFNASTGAQVGDRTVTDRNIVGAGVSTCAPVIL